ncbi:abortive infection system antitoxin AbiGi family protein [Flavobacterium soli]|uniref:abortive infection system antitoxin AbiGi family protein n=1 Tax=Flavobacterium soli TaxID=344881 RepID=UPI00041BA69F|nr:abortive infection system antitoxin AbiGi family protein [Flavobacterium soli]
MAISTNSVIHYTNKVENLKGIITSQGFNLKYCSERIMIENGPNLSVAFPMVSFCDIPLSEVKNHIDSYGSYAIGLTKSWAKATGLNPVLYLEKESRLTKNIGEQYRRIIELRKAKSNDINLQSEHIAILSHCKNYEGKLIHGKINSETYRFYDEREWRFVAGLKELEGAPLFIAGKNYKEDKETHNIKLVNCSIKFSFDDISYIIVEDENDIPEILTLLNTVYEDKCTTKQLKILSTRIITKSQIYNDF